MTQPSSKTTSTRTPLWMALATALQLGVVGCGSSSQVAGNDVVVGLLLPFTGTSSGTASNFERSTIFAIDRINEGGGIAGRRLRLVGQDTHSDLDRARQSAAALADQGAIAVLGPESSDIALSIKPLLDEQGVVFMSPMIGAADDALVDCKTSWFRLAPSSRALGEALAKVLFNNKSRRAAVLYEVDSYDKALSEAAASRFKSLGGTVALSMVLDPKNQSYSSATRDVLNAGVDSVVLATSPRTGALVVNEMGASTAQPPKFFLSPLLKTEVFLQNVAPETIEGALGVTPKIYDNPKEFTDAFAQRWQGDQPLEGSFFYYDAMAVLALALQRAALSSDGSIEASPLRAEIIKAAAPPGVAANWNSLEQALQNTAHGSVTYYSGLTGPLFFGACGSRQSGTTTVWKVESGKILDQAGG
jgi:branched-chain amino acid transport system substrate-binding protein